MMAFDMCDGLIKYKRKLFFYPLFSTTLFLWGLKVTNGRQLNEKQKKSRIFFVTTCIVGILD